VISSLDKHEYIEAIRKAGFRDVEIVSEQVFTEPNMEERLIGKIVSVQVKALK
jgi:arsenite methyltransferase